jgi:hypothetical protein
VAALPGRTSRPTGPAPAFAEIRGSPEAANALAAGLALLRL